MSRKLRRVLFWVCVALFAIIGSILVVYAFGYRMDWDKMEFTQTGGLYIKTAPKITDITLNKKPLDKKVGLLSSGILIKNLIPKIYSLTISRDGYFNWEKEVEVGSSLVENFTHVVLLPQAPLKDNFYTASTTEEILNYKLINNNTEILLELKSKEKSINYHLINLYNVKDKTFVNIFKKKITKSENLDLLDDLILDGTEVNRILIPYYDSASAKTIYYLWDRSEPDALTNFSTTISQYTTIKVKKVWFHPFEESKFFILTSKRFMTLDLNKKALSYFSATNPVDFYVGSGDVYWIEKDGSIYSYDLIFNSTSPVTILDDEDWEISKWEFSSNSNYLGILLKSGKLLLISPGQSTKILGENVFDFSFSVDNKKVAFSQKDGFVKIYFIEDLIQDIIKKAGDVIILENFGNQLEQMVWYKDSYHLLINSGDQIFFSEIDDRDNVNIFSYKFGNGNYELQGDGLVFRSGTTELERINLVVSE